MTKTSTIRPLSTLLALLLLALLVGAGSASASEVHEQAFTGGSVVVSANDNFTEGKLERLSYTFEGCGTEDYETACTWEVTARLATEPSKRCDAATPSPQTIWTSGEQSGNGTVNAPVQSFALEGCPGQVFTVSYSYMKSFDPPKEGGIIVTGHGGSATLAFITFGPNWQEVIEAASPPAPTFQPNFTPGELRVASDCRSLTIGNVAYVFSFRGIGCRKASNLAKMRHLSGRAPSGYHCRNVQANGGVLCWRIGHPEKRLEWRLPGTKPAHLPAAH